MRALGFHPTAAEIAALNNEARSLHALDAAAAAASRAGGHGPQQPPKAGGRRGSVSVVADAALEAYTGGWAASPAPSAASSLESVTLPTLLKLYVNHRPVLPLGRDSVIRSVGSVAALGSDSGTSDVRWGALTTLLASRSEKLTGHELLACLTALMGPLGGAGGGQHIGEEEVIAGEEFADRVLGMAT